LRRKQVPTSLRGETPIATPVPALSASAGTGVAMVLVISLNYAFSQ
jgi:hypothetical protein